MRSLFVAIEGIDGSGKTTLIRGMKDLLVQKGIKAILFKEPGDDNPIGRAFRKMSEVGEEVPPLTSVFLLAAERHWRSIRLLRWLEQGYLVLADRYYLSGMVYCGAEGISFEEFSLIHKGILKPHLYIYLQISLAEASKRKTKAMDRWGKKDVCRKAARLYPKACEYVRIVDGADVRVVDASKPKESVLQQAFLCISSKLGYDNVQKDKGGN